MSYSESKALEKIIALRQLQSDLDEYIDMLRQVLCPKRDLVLDFLAYLYWLCPGPGSFP